MERALQITDIDQVFLIGLDGQLHMNSRASRKVLETRLETSDQEGVPSARQVRAFLRVLLAEPDEDGDDLVYEGEVGYYVEVSDEANLSEAQVPQLIALVWPYLRIALIEHAARFGQSRIPLPLFLTREQLLESAAPAETVRSSS